MVVSDRQALDAALTYAAQQRALVEPACGAALSIVQQGPLLQQALAAAAPRAGDVHVVAVVCGGSAVSVDLLADLDRSVSK
jgi:L-serine/L-threonine ammonia-lyase